MPNITRSVKTFRDVAAGTTLAASDSVPMENYAWGSLAIPTGSAIGSLTWYAASAPNEEYLPVYDGETQLTSTVIAGRAYPLPSSLAAHAHVKAVADFAGTFDMNLKG